MSNAPFPIDPELTAIAIAYRNGRMIADEVLPRVPVGKQSSSSGSTTSPRASPCRKPWSAVSPSRTSGV